MTKRDLLSMALNVLGVFTLIHFVADTPRLLSFAVEMGSGKISGMANPKLFAAMEIVSLVLYIFFSVILIFRGDVISRKLIRDNSDLVLPNDNRWDEKIFVLALRVVGVVLVVQAIPNLLNILVTQAVWAHASAGLGFAYALATRWATVVQAVVTIAMGAYLVSGASYLVGLIFRDRSTEPEPID